MFGKDNKIDAIASSVLQVIEKVTTDTTKGREEGSINSFTPAKVTLKGDVEKKPEGKKPEETAARKSIETKGVKTEETVQEVSPPGWSGTVKAMKKHKNISNPFALAWSMKNKGAKSHIKAEEYVDESVLGALKSGAKKVLAKVGGGSDEDQLKRLQKNMGVPQTGKPAMAKQNEETVEEELKGGQKKIDKNHNGKIDAQDFKILRKEGAELTEAKAGDSVKIHMPGHPLHGLSGHVFHSGNGNVHVELHDRPKQHEWQSVKNVSLKPEQVVHHVNEDTVEEGWDDMLKSVAEKNKPQPNGGAGKKQGSAYGGSKQKDKPEQDVKEGYEDSAEDKAEDKKEAKKRHMSMKEWEKSAADKKQDMKEGKEEVPFDPPYKEKKETVTDKSGAKHTPMSRAKNLARAAMDKIKKDHKLG